MKLTEEQFEALKAWVDAIFDEGAQRLLGRDCADEYLRRSALEDELRKVLVD